MGFPTMPKDKVERMLKEGRLHLRFVISLYQLQLEAGRHILHEHPAGALSWQVDHTTRLFRYFNLDSVVSHQCEYGLLTPRRGGCSHPREETYSPGIRFFPHASAIIATLQKGPIVSIAVKVRFGDSQRRKLLVNMQAQREVAVDLGFVIQSG